MSDYPKTITEALIAFHGMVPTIDKDATGQRNTYASLANILSTVTPVLNKCGMVLTQEFLGDSLITTLRHVSGEIINSSCTLAIPNGPHATQAWGSAVTYQRRYSVCAILSLVALMDEQNDPDALTPPSTKTTPAQTKPANVKQAVASQAFQAGQKAIKAAKTLNSLSDLRKRVAERFDKKDLSKQEYDDLLKLLLNKESELKEFEK